MLLLIKAQINMNLKKAEVVERMSCASSFITLYKSNKIFVRVRMKSKSALVQLDRLGRGARLLYVRQHAAHVVP